LTNDFRIENFFDLEGIIDFDEFKKAGIENTEYYDSKYWTRFSYGNIDEDRVLKELFN